MFRRNAQATLKIITMRLWEGKSISGLVVEYIVAIGVTRIRFPAEPMYCGGLIHVCAWY
jgi:hypothetical protein